MTNIVVEWATCYLQASSGRSDMFELARRVSEHQARLRAATRKIMATVSELSLYQVGQTA